MPQQPKAFDILGAPALRPSVQSLDTIFVKMRPLISKIEPLFEGTLSGREELRQIKATALGVNQDLSRWRDNQPTEWKPTVLGVWSPCDYAPGDSIFWPGLVEAYFDRK